MQVRSIASRPFLRFILWTGVAAFTFSFTPSSATAQNKQDKKATADPVLHIKTAPARYTSPASGKEMYAAYCAPCHGLSARGDGPAAPALKHHPSNLTLLAKKNGGGFPYLHVAETLRNGGQRHPTDDVRMPVWRTQFRYLDSPNVSVANLRIINLTNYVSTLQVK